MIGIVDIQISNIGSVLNAVRFLGIDYVIVNSPQQLAPCDLIILPGVGSFDSGMKVLVERGLDTALVDACLNKKKLLGICLGMQLLFSKSDEGSQAGLGFFEQDVSALRAIGCIDKVPHVGFNEVYCEGNDDFSQKYHREDFYFVHSYAVSSEKFDIPHWRVKYGGMNFVSFVRKNNIFGAQFHPEKSGKIGLDLIRDIYSC